MRRGLKVSDHDLTLFGRASEIARSGEHAVRVGAVLAKGLRTINSGHNRYRNDMRNVPYGYATWHAERQVVSQVGKRNCTLYVARLGINGHVLASWPCDECLEHIVACDCVGKVCFFDGQAIVKVRL